MPETKKKTLLWIALGCTALLLLGIVIGELILLRIRATTAPETTATTTQPTTATTLPPPPENVFDPADFQYDESGYLACVAAPYERGIDVSSYQGQIDWQAVAQSGVTFVIIRAGGRGYGNGELYEDSRAQLNYQGAKEAGLKVGTYFFSQAISTEEAVQEAEYLLELTQNWQLDMPVVYDWEYISPDARTGLVDRQTLTDCMLSFCQRIEQAGHQSMVYFNPTQSRDLFHIEQITDYPFWLAMYSDWMTYPYRIDMWQYTNEGQVPGIQGNVDINLYFPYEELE